MPKFKDIASRFAVLLHAIIFVVVLYFAYTHYHESKEKMINNTQNRLALDAKIQKSFLSKQFSSTDSELLFLAQTGALKLGLDTLKTTWAELGKNASKILIQNYITQNKFSDKSTLQTSDTNNTYDILHQALHRYLHELQQSSKYQDILLLDMDGNILYTVQKSQNFAQNISSQDPHLKKVFTTLLTQKEGVSYQPFSQNAQSFIATIVQDELKEPIGVLVFALKPFDTKAYTILTSRENCQERVEQSDSFFKATSCLSYKNYYWRIQTETKSEPLFSPIRDAFYKYLGTLFLLSLLALALSYLILEKLMKRKEEDD